MTKLGTIKFSGQSGARYAFTVYPLGTAFEERFAGVYVCTRRRRSKARNAFVHRRIEAGQSDDLRVALAGNGQSRAARGANCICVHAESDDGIRQRIERDLLPASHADTT